MILIKFSIDLLLDESLKDMSRKIESAQYIADRIEIYNNSDESKHYFVNSCIQYLKFGTNMQLRNYLRRVFLEQESYELIKLL